MTGTLAMHRPGPSTEIAQPVLKNGRPVPRVSFLVFRRNAHAKVSFCEKVFGSHSHEPGDFCSCNAVRSRIVRPQTNRALWDAFCVCLLFRSGNTISSPPSFDLRQHSHA